MNTNEIICKPSNDINCYFNKRWISKTEIPEDKGHYGSFTILDEEIFVQISELLDTLKPDNEPGKNNFYIVKDQIYNQNFNYKIPAVYVDVVRSIKDNNELIVVLSLLHQVGISTLFDFSCFDDLYRGDKYRLYLSHEGYSIPQYSYDGNLRWYSTYIKEYSHLFYKNAGIDPKNLDKAIEIETLMAKNGITLNDDRKVETSYFEMKIDEFLSDGKSVYSEDGSILWQIIMKLCNVDYAELIVLNFPKTTQFVTKLILSSIDKEILEYLKTYLEWQLIQYFTEYDYQFADIYRRHITEKFSGAKKTIAKDKFCFHKLDNFMDHMIGELYMEKYCNQEVINMINTMVITIIEATKELIKNTKLTGETKKKAIDKLSKMRIKLGGPKVYERFETVKMGEDLFESLLNINMFLVNKYLYKRIDQPIDREVWAMSAHHVNAYYSPSKNEIVLPCAIYQPPFYNHSYHPIINYGGIGTVIGHEIIHGFDDEGRKYTAEGKYQDWWTKEDHKIYKERIEDKVIKHYSRLSIDGVRIDGNLTVGENIADIGGLNTSFHAYAKYIHNNLDHNLFLEYPLIYQSQINIRIITQMFIHSWSRVWRVTMRKQKLLHRVMTDYHSPGPIRINAALAHFPIFYSTYLVGPKDDMYIPEKERSTFLITNYNLSDTQQLDKQELFDLLRQFEQIYPNQKVLH